MLPKDNLSPFIHKLLESNIKNITMPLISEFLKEMGYSGNTSRIIVHGSQQLARIGLTSIADEQGIQPITRLYDYLFRENIIQK
jgi:hypothetical protein